MTKSKKAKYKCLTCGHEWEWDLNNGPNPHHQGCPKCESLYYRWVNYLELFPVPEG